MSYTPDAADPRRPRHDGWTAERQLAFLEELGEHGNVSRAAAAVGLSPSSAYRLRGRQLAADFARGRQLAADFARGRELAEDSAFGEVADPAPGGSAFVAGWRAARAMAHDRLCDLALERIATGVVTPVFRQGEVVGTRLVYSDRLMLGMLAHLRGGSPDADAAHDPADTFAVALDAVAVAAETGTVAVMPAGWDAPPPGAGFDDLIDDDADDAGFAAVAAGPSPGEGSVHEARVAAAIARLAAGRDPHPQRFAGRTYAPHPDATWLAAYPDGLTAADLAREDPAALAAVGLARETAAAV